MEKGSKALSSSDWEQVIPDFGTSEAIQQKWLAAYPAQALLELALNIIVKERGADFALKQQLLVFLEEHGALLIGADVSAGLGRVCGVLKTLLAGSGNPPLVNQTLLTQVVSLAAVLAVQTESQESAPGQLEALVDLLLNVVSRVNSLPDRQVRGAACEALRGLECAFPGLLHLTLGHLLGFCQLERTHVAQSYILLFLEILEHAALFLFQGAEKGEDSRGGQREETAGHLPALSQRTTSWVPAYLRGSSHVQGGGNSGNGNPQFRRTSSSPSALLSAILPLTPFSLPPFLSSKLSTGSARAELSEGNLREFRRAVSFLLENTGVLSEPATAKLVSSLIRIVAAVRLPVSIFKHHFAGLSHSSSPVLIHAALQVYVSFPEAFSDASERTILLERLAQVGNDPQQLLSARLLSLHWLLAIATSVGKVLEPLSCLPFLQPAFFDPIAVKASKLEALAALTPPPSNNHSQKGQLLAATERNDASGAPSNPAEPSFAVTDFDAGSAASLEAAVAFRTLHRFLTSRRDGSFSRGSDGSAQSGHNPQTSPVFQQISDHLVAIAAQHPAQMPNILALLDRLLTAKAHFHDGNHLLRAMETSLLPKLQPSQTLPAYFPLFRKVVTHSQGDPKPLLNLLARYCTKWASAGGAGRGLGAEAWLRGSEVLEVCRSVMLVQPRGEILEPLGELMDGLAEKFPDVDVRDSARLYSSLLQNLPQERLRAILSDGDNSDADSAMLLRNTSVSPSPPEPRPAHDVASYVLLRRLSEPLGMHAWMVALSDSIFDGPEPTASGSPDTAAHSRGRPAEKRSESRAAAKQRKKEQNATATGRSASGQAETSRTDRYEGPRGDRYEGSGMDRSEESESTSGERERAGQGSERTILDRYREELERGSRDHGTLRIPCSLRYVRRPQTGESKDDDRGMGTGVSDQDGGESETVRQIGAGVNVAQGEGTNDRHVAEGDGMHLLDDAHVAGAEMSDSDMPEKKREGGVSEAGNLEAGVGVNTPTAIFAAVLTFETAGSYEPIPAVHVPFLLEESEEDVSGGNSSAETHPPEVVDIELRPIQPVPTLVESWVEFTDENGKPVKGRLQATSVGFEDLFSETLNPADVADHVAWRAQLFDAMWDALGRPESTERNRTSGNGTDNKTGNLNGAGNGNGGTGSGNGAQSVKLLETDADVVVEAVERYLAPFVTAVAGERLVEIVIERGLIEAVRWDVSERGGSQECELLEKEPRGESPRLQLAWGDGEKGQRSGSGGALGSFQLLVFLPPRYHLLLRVEVSDWSSLVHIRTDFWPCLAYVDDYLEALVAVA